jgi:hypothetical protein
MTNFKKQLVSATAAGAMLLNVAMPAFAGTEIVISGNGAGSDNWTTVNQVSTTTVTQQNQANVTNNVNADAKTGGNDANFNTGGQVNVDTGDAKTDVSVSNVLNSNSASVDCCASGDTEVEISGNGAKSDNGVVLLQTTNTGVAQSNNAYVNNNVDADAKTGGNNAGYNTGGDVTVKTGNAESKVDVSTTANVNSAVVGGGLGHSNPSASFIISGNGAYSDNYITAALVNTTEVLQGNEANITNNVDADAKTGGNDANFNTGGDVSIMTGNAKTDVDVDNAVNFNFADVECGCTWDVLAKIAGNGAEGQNHHWWWDSADNIIDLTLVSAQAVGQGNGATLNNNVDEDAKTGYNEASKNTGEVDGDPSVVTGNATSESDVENSGNVNVVGDMDIDLPEMPEVDFSFSFAALLAFFGMSI